MNLLIYTRKMLALAVGSTVRARRRCAPVASSSSNASRLRTPRWAQQSTAGRGAARDRMPCCSSVQLS